MTRFTFQGTGHTTGGGGGKVLLIIGILLVAGPGAVAEISRAFVVLVITLTFVVVAGVAGLGAYLVHRARQEREPRKGVFLAPEVGVPPGFIPPSAALLPPERPAIEAPRPQVVNNFFVVSADEAAEIIRRQQAAQ